MPISKKQSTQLRAGTYRIDITPPLGHRMQGHDARLKVARSVHDPLMLKILTITDGRIRLALITSDALHFDEATHRSVREAIFRRTGIASQHVLLSASHTHTGPFVVPGSEHYMEDYVSLLKQQIAGGVGAAIATEKAAQLSFGEGQIDIGSMNRRRMTARGIVMEPNPTGPVDRHCGVLRVDNLDARPMAILFQYACHPTTLATDLDEISADYPGQAQQLLERAYPGAQAMFINGCCGDVRPAIIENNRFTGGNFEDAARLGRLLASEVIRCRERATPLRRHRLSGRTVRHAYALDERWLGAGPERLRRLVQQWVLHDADARTSAIVWLDHWLTQQADVPRATCLHGDVQVLHIGELSVLALTGEVMSEYALAIRSNHRRHLLIACYAQASMGYIPTARALREGGYEARSFMSHRYPAPYASRVEEDLLQTAAGLLR